MSISAVIATRNSSKTIVKCLTSIRESNRFSEVVVVDAHSKDATVKLANHFNVQVCMEWNQGFFGAYNMGFERTTSDYVMFIDSDAYLKGFDFARALTYFNDAKVGLVVCLARAPVTNWVSKMVNAHWEWRMNEMKKYQLPSVKLKWTDRQIAKFFMSKNIASGATTTGPCYILRRSAVEKMGGINPRGDDFALRRMLENVGYVSRFYLSDSVYHVPRTSLNKLFREYAHFGLRGAQISENFFTRRERMVGLLMSVLSFATAPSIARFSRDPRQLFLVPALRATQICGYIVGNLFLDEKPEKNYNAY
jgi:glycosyltransferase involved in cell wall biosynthesis